MEKYNFCNWEQVGQAWVFGQNSDGQLGLHVIEQQIVPQFHSLPNYAEFTDLTSVDNVRERWAQRWNFHFSNKVVIGASTGTHHILFQVLEDFKPDIHNDRTGKFKTLYCCGANNSGQLGLGTKAPSKVPQLIPKIYYNAYKYEVEAIASGAKHNIAVTKEYGGTTRRVWSWGAGMAGKLGHGDMLSMVSPKGLDTQFQFSQVAAGSVSSAGITPDGQLYTWGSNYNGETGCNSEKDCISSPVRIDFLLFPAVYFVSVVVGAAHTMALASNGYLYISGNNTYGQLGLGLSFNKTIRNFTRIDSKIQFVSMSCGLHFNVAVSANGQVYTWGRYERGRLGYRTNRHQTTPKLVNLPPIDFVACSDNSTIAVTKTKRLYSWGNNKFSQLGFTAREDVSESAIIDEDDDFEPSEEVPVLLKHLKGVSKINSPGSYSGRQVVAIITGKMELIHQFIRDLNYSQVTRAFIANNNKNIYYEKDDEGYNTVHWLAKMGFHKALTEFVKEGAKVESFLENILNSTDPLGKTALHICSENGFFRSATILVNNGASITARDSKGKIPLHYAIENNHSDIAEFLIIKSNSGDSLLGLRDKSGLTPLDYCTFEQAYQYKCHCNDYLDIYVINSVEQKQLCAKIVAILKSSHIKVVFDNQFLSPDDYEIEQKCKIISRAKGIIYILGPTSIDSNGVEKKYLEYAKNSKKQIFPVWEKVIDLPADLEATVFRYQVLDLSSNATFEENSHNLANSITVILSTDLSKSSELSNDLRRSLGDDAIDGSNAEFYNEFIAKHSNTKILYVLYEYQDSQYAKDIITQFDEKTKEMKCFDSRNCSDKSVLSTMARNCHSVLVILSNTAVKSSYIRDQMSVAENNRKQIYSVYIGEVPETPTDFHYTLAITPKFKYHHDTIAHQLLNEFKLSTEVDDKIFFYNRVLENVNQ